jgi:hypothetical protein
MSRLAPERVVASFDSASVLHAATVAALHGQTFSHLGNGALAGALARAGGRLPWPLLRHVYTRLGASEGVAARRLGDVDMAAVAQAFADDYPRRRYPAVMVGSSNGALAHLAAAMQVPWLPDTTLLPVARTGDPQRPSDALRFGARVAAPLLERNPDSVLHHMHDQVQDELMVARMTYFRLKWRRLPAAYADLLSACLAPGAPVLLVEDRSRWPVVRVGERHVFQTGAQGGWQPRDYLRRPHTPQPDDEAAEAEWGADPGFGESLARWCAEHGHPLLRLRYTGPQAPAHAVAGTFRRWYADRGERADRLVVPSFILGDPWRTVNAAAVPFWTFFSVQPAVDALDAHLASSAPYCSVDLMLFQHGVHSAGIAYPDEWEQTVRRHGATPRLVGLDPARFPHDIASLGRYGPALRELPPARRPWSPMDVDTAVDGLRAEGLDIERPTRTDA